MKITPAQRAWLEWLRLTSHPLRRVNDAGENDGWGSATLIEHRGRRFLLTCRHNVPIEGERWALDIGRHGPNGSEVLWLPSLQYVVEYKRSTGALCSIDFCYGEVPRDADTYWQERTFHFTGEPHMRHVFSTDHADVPHADQVYGFAGEIQPELHPRGVVMQPVAYPALKYARSDGELHHFKLPVPHPGHDAFRGCSGAPIVDMNRRVVAIVCGGDEQEGTIYGVSLARYVFALDFWCTLQEQAAARES